MEVAPLFRWKSVSLQNEEANYLDYCIQLHSIRKERRSKYRTSPIENNKIFKFQKRREENKKSFPNSNFRKGEKNKLKKKINKMLKFWARTFCHTFLDSVIK